MQMNDKKIKISSIVLWGIYLYQALPILIFFLGWCRWYIGIPAAAIVIFGVFLCMKEHRVWKYEISPLTGAQKLKIIAIVVIVVIWAGLSGVGGYFWQNTDHTVRNTMFELLVNERWPVVENVDIGGQMQSRGIMYYIGYWLPSALAGKLLGIQAGYAVQYLWAVIGILLFYSLICIWRKKIVIWPLFVFIFFSGLDAVGMAVSEPGILEIFGDAHLEAWSQHYQFSSTTTQLFWVFNQAIPVWLASLLIFLGEKPKNIIFTWSLVMLTSTFPFIGLLPFVIYFMIHRPKWNADNHSVRQVAANCWDNWGSVQNLLAGGVVGIISSFYLLGNSIFLSSSKIFSSNGNSALILVLIVTAAAAAMLGFLWLAITVSLHGGGKILRYLIYGAGIIAIAARFARLDYSEWQSPLFFWMNMTVFYFLEVGIFLLVLYKGVIDKKLFRLTAVCLYVIPLIIIGNSCDFCMRASIPGLLLITLWCIQVLDRREEKMRTYLLILLLVIGAITPFHEIKRTYVNTRSYYENASVDPIVIYTGGNFSGSTDSFFWNYIAKPFEK